MNWETIFGYCALVTSVIGLTPQIYKTMKIKSAQDLSILMLINWMICSGSWIIHGYYTHAPFVVYSNIVGLFTGLILLAQKAYYDAQ